MVRMSHHGALDTWKALGRNGTLWRGGNDGWVRNPLLDAPFVAVGLKQA